VIYTGMAIAESEKPVCDASAGASAARSDGEGERDDVDVREIGRTLSVL
jgi:hypothetical protein